jgi:hypothetical protein
MKKIFFIAFVSMAVMSCNNNAKDVVDNKIALRIDTINVVKLSDTLVIFESTCRGCAYESSTNFAINDSMNIIKLADVVTTDNSPDDMHGGSISKVLILVPQKTGVTIFKLYKFWTMEKPAADSARFASYKIEVKQ